MNSDIALNLKTNRKIYYRDDFFRFYTCFEEIPDYLKDFQYLYNNFTQDNWCRKPIPKFEDINEVKGKLSYPSNKLKGRQRTLSNQSGENNVDSENFKPRTVNPNAKFSRSGTSVSETQYSDDIKWTSNNTFINPNDFVDNAQWQKVESKSSRPSHSSKSYAQNIQVTENHWKKWSKDSNSSMDKTRTLHESFNRTDRVNNWSRKTDDNRHRNTKTYVTHNLNKASDQTEDIWQDDWDTEMKSEIAKDEDDLILDSYQFPKSSILSITPPVAETEQIMVMKNQIFEQVPDPISSFDLWFYRDLSDIERGPFSSENMANWLATGYFNPSTFVRRSCDERFLLLAEYRALYQRIPFTAGPAYPPIYMNTPIEIDIKHLLIGVDSSLIPQVINCATCLPKITQSPMQQNNIKRVEENIKINPNSPEMLALLEEKRMIEKTRAELERERERMVQEQVQWRERIEAELKAKMEEIKLSLSSPVNNIDLQPMFVSQPQLTVTNEPMERCYDQATVDIALEPETPSSVKTDDCNYQVNTDVVLESTAPVTSTLMETRTSNSEPTNHWIIAKDVKHQKKGRRTRAKDKESGNKPAEETSNIVTIPAQTKIVEQPTDSRLSFISKETMLSMVNSDSRTSDTMKGRPIRFELDNRKTMDPVTIWTAPSTGRSLVDIQAEELTKNRVANESQKTVAELAEKPVANHVKNGDRSLGSQAPSSIWGALKKTPNPNLGRLEETSLVKIQSEELLKEKLVKEKKVIDQKSVVDKDKKQTKKEILFEIEKNQQHPLKPEPVSSWTTLASSNATTPGLSTVTTHTANITKSLKEIQAEEALQEKREKQKQNLARASEIEANKITSFKESLLKSTVPATKLAPAAKLPVIPSGKSIWDMSPTPLNTAPKPSPISVANTETVVKKAPQSARKDSDTELDQLTAWCVKKLARFSDKFDISTVIELLHQVPNEEVMELALQLIDDSKFTSSFVLEFIHKRQELSDRNGDAAGDSWQTVKKSLLSSPASAVSPGGAGSHVTKNTSNKGLKSKSKKKLVVIDAKFR